jgi:DNA polymerase-3 subunit alpha (Gram-positive type)
MQDHDYVVLDIETTGLSRSRHNITEIAAIKFRNGQFVGEFQTLVNPREHIPSFITQLTGIDDEMVKDAPPIEKALPNFIEFLGDATIVAHNASFDYGFIFENASRHLDVMISNDRLCTRRLANRIVPELPSKRLNCLCEHFDINNAQEHRAMGDARATAEIFMRFLSELSEKGIRTKEDLLRFQTLPAAKCRQLTSPLGYCQRS